MRTLEAWKLYDTFTYLQHKWN